MEEKLDQILAEVKSVKVELRAEMQDMKKELRAEMQEMKKELRTELDTKLNQLRSEFKEDLKAQTKEITQDYQDLIESLDRKYKRQEKINDEILRELRENRLAHQSYDARLYKIESSQRNLETKIYGILPA